MALSCCKQYISKTVCLSLLQYLLFFNNLFYLNTLIATLVNWFELAKSNNNFLVNI